MLVYGSLIEGYRQEAASLRDAAALIREERFRDQLLAIAEEYEMVVTSIEVRQSAPVAQSNPPAASAPWNHAD